MLRIREVTDLKSAELLWRGLSYNQTIFDEWDWRFCFYKYNKLPLCFLAAYEDEELVGLMPLERHPKHGLEFFAEDPSEESRPFVKSGHENIIPNLYGAIVGPAKPYDITGDDEFTKKLELEDYKYVLPLEGLNNFTDFLNSRLSAKRRNSLSKEIEAVAKNNFEIEIISPDKNKDKSIETLDSLFSFNVNNFGAESYLLEAEQAPWKDLLKLDFDWRLIALNITGQTQAVSFSIKHKGIWHYLITGANFKDYPGLGKYLVKVNIETAINEGANFFDAGLGDCGWKNLWHFDKIPQYLFKQE